MEPEKYSARLKIIQDLSHVIFSAKMLVADYGRYLRGSCDKGSFEDRIDQAAADIDAYRGGPNRRAMSVLAGIVAAYDAGWEDDPTAPDVTDSLMDQAREIVGKE